ncbi:rhodanese-related sulfurtransferase [Singulisphaera sp. Ch08]|uniref:tRNA uridine(34) hydroxylase n=1 Tax=Singulisphaera sp. Ch08 TaxID=3120278 RepID=A0AAU7CJ29_9BACT
MIIVAAFYHFFDFTDYEAFRLPLLDEMKRLQIKGSLLLAAEGINGTLSGDRASIDQYLGHLKQHVTKGEFEHKESLCDRQPFQRAKVRLKKEIISLGQPTSLAKTGHFVEPEDWNAFIANPETVMIDARNAYEVHLGSFERAIDPKTKSFKELPDFVQKTLDPAQHKSIAVFCTGGIRCEKFSAWLLEQGFEDVYQLKGGILKYLERIPEAESKWQGECYVFDERVAVGLGVTPSATASMCQACGHALTEADRQHSEFVPMVQCPFCVEA